MFPVTDNLSLDVAGVAQAAMRGCQLAYFRERADTEATGMFISRPIAMPCSNG
jgi:hypothetical protein